MKVTIHQPEHIPWLGFFDKVSKADVFVILDSVQFRKNYFQNRNKILPDQWLTVPIKKHHLTTKIKDIQISDRKWRMGYLDQVRHVYKKTEFYQQYFPEFVSIINKGHTSLSELNIELIDWAMKIFGLTPEVYLSSSLDHNDSLKASDLVLEICKSLGATEYISGAGGHDYLKVETFNNCGIEVTFNKPDYPKLSFLDHLFKYGNNNFNQNI